MLTEIDNQILNKFDKLITEELCISSDVETLSIKVCNTIKTKLKNIVEEQMFVDPVLNLQHLFFKIPIIINEQEIIISTHIINVDNTQDKIKALKIGGIFFTIVNKTDYSNKTITLTFYTINKKINTITLSNNVQHELSHMFDYIMRGYKNVDNFIDRKIYNTAIKVLNSYNNTTFEYELAYGLYISFKSEIIGFINGFNSEIKELFKENPSLPWWLILPKTECYSNVKILEKILRDLDKIDEHLIKTLFGITTDIYKAKISKALKTYTIKIGKVLSRYTSLNTHFNHPQLQNK